VRECVFVCARILVALRKRKRDSVCGGGYKLVERRKRESEIMCVCVCVCLHMLVEHRKKESVWLCLRVSVCMLCVH